VLWISSRRDLCIGGELTRRKVTGSEAARWASVCLVLVALCEGLEGLVPLWEVPRITRGNTRGLALCYADTYRNRRAAVSLLVGGCRTPVTLGCGYGVCTTGEPGCVDGLVWVANEP
jgi:hypothetical protein